MHSAAKLYLLSGAAVGDITSDLKLLSFTHYGDITSVGQFRFHPRRLDLIMRNSV